MKFEGWRLTRWLALAILATCALQLAAEGWSEEGLRRAVRASARISVSLFSVAFAASSLCSLWPSPATRWLLRHRRQIGVSFAFSHALHLASLVAIALWFPEPLVSGLTVVGVVGGGIGYGFIFALTLTSSDAARARLGAGRWRGLHRVGSYYIWIIFAQSYFPRAVEKLGYVPAAVPLVAALLLRLYAGARKRRKQSYG